MKHYFAIQRIQSLARTRRKREGVLRLLESILLQKQQSGRDEMTSVKHRLCELGTALNVNKSAVAATCGPRHIRIRCKRTPPMNRLTTISRPSSHPTTIFRRRKSCMNDGSSPPARSDLRAVRSINRGISAMSIRPSGLPPKLEVILLMHPVAQESHTRLKYLDCRTLC